MPDGSKGDQLPAVAGGDSVEILLEKGTFRKREQLPIFDPYSYFYYNVEPAAY